MNEIKCSVLSEEDKKTAEKIIEIKIESLIKWNAGIKFNVKWLRTATKEIREEILEKELSINENDSMIAEKLKEKRSNEKEIDNLRKSLECIKTTTGEQK